jgi:hypothetical protein
MANLEKISEEIRRNMAIAFFASAWADQCEESGDASILSGKEILSIMPADIDPAAIHAARTLEMGVLSHNKSFTCLAGALDWLETVCPEGGDRDRTPEMLGHYMAMQAMGHGVGLHDAFGQSAADEINIPYVEFGGYSLERDYFS